jgi:hypothetical protein
MIVLAMRTIIGDAGEERILCHTRGFLQFPDLLYGKGLYSSAEKDSHIRSGVWDQKMPRKG